MIAPARLTPSTSAAEAALALAAGGIALAADQLAGLARPGLPGSSAAGRTATFLATRPALVGYAGAPAAAVSGGTIASTVKAATTKGTSSKTTTTSKPKGPLAFLDDKTLSVDEKLFRFLLYVADKYEKAIDKKLQEIAGKTTGSASGATKTTTTTPKKKKGILGGLGDLVSKAFDVAALAVMPIANKDVRSVAKQVSGPVLAAAATAMGQPQLAPAALQLGPSLVDGAGSLIDGAKAALTGSGSSGSGSGSSSGSTSSSSSASSGEPDVSQKDALELQRLQDKQKEMFSLVSNMLRAMHETRMNVIANIRA